MSAASDPWPYVRRTSRENVLIFGAEKCSNDCTLLEFSLFPLDCGYLDCIYFFPFGVQFKSLSVKIKSLPALCK